MDVDEDIIVRDMNVEEASQIDKRLGRSNQVQSIYKSYVKETTSGQCLYMVIYYKKQLAGFAKIDWKSNYEDFEEEGIPEVKEIFIFEDFRHKGLGNQLIHQIEERVKARCEFCAIGVGLAEPYESAQKLLATRGYEPDGRGIFYFEPESVQDVLEVDDYQALMMIKKL